ncbi:MAG: WecB/TagA/CpsF family glycosyltransferase [Gammaproteobacteria bacterium]|nr:WecB/TagA/CpsF family glycosyltransferase [Gammaproteobacteria bacterium]
MTSPRRVTVLGVPVDCVDMDRALSAVDDMVAGDQPRTILAVNPEKVMKAQNDPVLSRALNDAGLLIPDGIGVVYAVRTLWGERIARVPGSELMPAICARAAERGYKVFLFGASREVNDQAVVKLRAQYPGIQIVGHHDGYVDEAGMPRLIEAIDMSGAQILFVALGSPKQELWMEKYLPRLHHVRVCQGVGGTFDVIAGRVRRAPALFRNANLEWFYRLITEPRRALRQVVLPQFTLAVFRAKLSSRP